MLDQSRLEQLKTWTEADLPNILPAAENTDFEFKSSLIADGKLQSVLQKAASGFWNSGGGYFIAGVDEKTGQPDGGISTTVGRTPRRDWIDRALSAVSPGHPNGYLIQEIISTGAGLNINPGKAVYVVGFVGSELAPHMADGSYYIRSGAHTDPASAFIVEALFARRGRRQPQLRLEFRTNPLLHYVVELGIVNVGLTPAIDVVAEFTIRPPGAQVDSQTKKATARKNLLDREHPLYITYVHNLPSPSPDEERLRRELNHVTLSYKDQFLNEYKESLDFQMNSAIEVSSLDATVLDRVALSLRNISVSIAQLAEAQKPK